MARPYTGLAEMEESRVPLLPKIVVVTHPNPSSLAEKALFVTSEGVGFPESTIGKRLTAFIEKCGVSLGGRMAFVDMR